MLPLMLAWTLSEDAAPPNSGRFSDTTSVAAQEVPLLPGTTYPLTEAISEPRTDPIQEAFE